MEGRDQPEDAVYNRDAKALLRPGGGGGWGRAVRLRAPQQHRHGRANRRRERAERRRLPLRVPGDGRVPGEGAREAPDGGDGVDRGQRALGPGDAVRVPLQQARARLLPPLHQLQGRLGLPLELLPEPNLLGRQGSQRQPPRLQPLPRQGTPRPSSSHPLAAR
eukprot:2916995-Rhodomonas_salina.3